VSGPSTPRARSYAFRPADVIGRSGPTRRGRDYCPSGRCSTTPVGQRRASHVPDQRSYQCASSRSARHSRFEVERSRDREAGPVSLCTHRSLMSRSAPTCSPPRSTSSPSLAALTRLGLGTSTGLLRSCWSVVRRCLWSRRSPGSGTGSSRPRRVPRHAVPPMPTPGRWSPSRSSSPWASPFELSGTGTSPPRRCWPSS
jgi:hypothetical protein